MKEKKKDPISSLAKSNVDFAQSLYSILAKCATSEDPSEAFKTRATKWFVEGGWHIVPNCHETRCVFSSEAIASIDWDALIRAVILVHEISLEEVKNTFLPEEDLQVANYEGYFGYSNWSTYQFVSAIQHSGAQFLARSIGISDTSDFDEDGSLSISDRRWYSLLSSLEELVQSSEWVDIWGFEFARGAVEVIDWEQILDFLLQQ